MKNFVRKTLILSALLALAACNTNKPNGSGGKQSDTPAGADTNEPVFSGVNLSLSVEAGKSLNLLEGVTAVDDVDGDVTDKIVISSMPELTITNGVVSPGKDETGFYDITYAVSDAAGNEAFAYTELTVTEAFAERTLYKEYNFGDNLQGWEPYMNEAVTGTNGVVGGKYVFDVTQSTGTDWHIKFAHYNYPVQAGHSYKITANFRSNKAGKVMFNGVEKNASNGNNSFVATMDAKVDAAQNIELQFGKLQGPFKVEIESIKIEDMAKKIDESQTEDVVIQTTGLLTEGWAFNKGDYHCEFSAGTGGSDPKATLVKSADQAVLTVTKTSANAWRGKFIIQTKNNLTAGVKYTMKVDLVANAELSGFEYGYGSWDDDFKKWGATYGWSLGTTKKTVTIECTPDTNFENPMFCLKMGNAPVDSVITASNFSVTYDSGAGEIDFTDEAFANAWSETEGRNTVIDRTETSITTKLTGAAQDPYKASTDINIGGIGLLAAKSYRVTLKLKSSVDLDKVNYMMGAPDWDPNSLFVTGETISLKANEAKTIKAIFTAETALGNAKMRIKYGNAPADTEFTVSDLTLEKIGFVEAEPTNVLAPTWSFNSSNRSARTAGDNKPNLSKTAEYALFTSTFKGDCWKSKAIIEPDAQLVSGVRYHVAVTIETSESVTGFEVGLGYEEGDYKQFDHKYEVKFTAATPTVVEFFYECDANSSDYWGIGIWMGTAPVGSTVKVSNLVVEELPAAADTTEKTYLFTPEGIGHYANEDAGAHSDLYVENGVLVYDITALSHESDWYNKFFLQDILLAGGSKYIFQIVAKADTTLYASLILNKSGDWDVRASKGIELTTEYQTFELESDLMAADLTFELLLQDLHQNETVNAAKISFQSIRIYSQAQAE